MREKIIALATNIAPPWYTPITEELLRKITRQIVKTFRPEKVILFGSYANGKPTIHSDIDLLVITRAMAQQSVFARHRAVSKLFPQRRFSLDVLVRTPSEVKARLSKGDRFMQEIIEGGRILYEQRHPGRMGLRSRNGLQKRS